MSRPALQINSDRLWSTLEEMAKIGATPAGGCNRQALTDLDRQARDLFVHWAQEAGCTVEIDEVGNIFARREGTEPDAPAVLAGSHLDTQATGGKYDGVYGVLAGLEVLRVIHENAIATRAPLEVAVWTNEEGCRFAPAMLGSGVVSGAYTRDFAYDVQDKSGLRLRDELERIGYMGERAAAPRPYAAMFEAHIEQGPILEKEGLTIGAVTGIQGAYWFDVTFTGQSCHAGPTPMEMRRDPWDAALPVMAGVLALARANGPWGRATIGDVRAEPGSRNTVPNTLTVSIDIRHPDADTLEEMVGQLRALVELECSAHTIESKIEQVWHMPATAFDPALVECVASAADRLGYSWMRMVSGAGHDSLHTAQFAPTTMIFVPCADGLSHNEAESATISDLAAGANVLLQVMLEMASEVPAHLTIAA
ncbi:Zn-dependent hydrolase [Novosphingobium taihuense]|uniref:N-carbamoyl-L-amino-acid hydrolase n=1 Tax=Novosphingobium taihuense TaxID=260085 RepID=A0A7W7EUP9_9SPHN|nr:Zn-dependent hydrolase [Novosphingobium taihuense]MBB4614176.1 N-carbamoyl-L-amino-acid hydrolase [Novosphingobium taihuense]